MVDDSKSERRNRNGKQVVLALLVVLGILSATPGVASAQSTHPIDTDAGCGAIADEIPHADWEDVCLFGVPPGNPGSGIGSGTAGTAKSVADDVVGWVT